MDLGLLWSLADTFNGMMVISQPDCTVPAVRYAGEAGEEQNCVNNHLNISDDNLIQYKNREVILWKTQRYILHHLR